SNWGDWRSCGLSPGQADRGDGVQGCGRCSGGRRMAAAEREIYFFPIPGTSFTVLAGKGLIVSLLAAFGAGDLVPRNNVVAPAPPREERTSISDNTARPAGHRLSSAWGFPALVKMLAYS